MTAEEHLRAGRLSDCLQSLQEAIRGNASDAKLRVFLFQLLCVMGQWERALTQLQVLASLGPETMMMARVFEPVLQCEMFRARVFAGQHTPLIFGEPQEWMGQLIQANDMAAKGQSGAAQELRDKAFEAAPAIAGTITRHTKPEDAAVGKAGEMVAEPFEWIADADVRLGPMLEAVVEGHYYWVPFSRIKSIHLETPSDLRDLVWAPAQFVWTNGGEASGHISTRYPGTDQTSDDQLRLARKTDWVDRDGFTTGLGQRLFATDAGEYPLLSCRTIQLMAAP